MLVLINHAVLFSMPFAIWTGAGGLWTSAAEMFLLLSGITYGIVRGGSITTQFKAILKKTWRRAAIIYAANVLVVFLSLFLALFLTSHNLTNDVNGVISSSSPPRLILDILTFRYSIGWADFLMYFSVFLALAPFMLYVLKTRLWPVVPATSFAVFTAHYFGLSLPGIYGTFAVWQVYFVFGLAIGRFRPQLIDAVASLPKLAGKIISYSVISSAAVLITLSYLLEHSIYPTVSQLANDGWLPVKLQAIYLHLLNLRTGLDKYLLDDRNGLARPFVSLLVATSVYFVYRRYGQRMLDLTGRFFLALGRDSLWIFVGQAFAIPVIAALPVAHGGIINNLALTGSLILSMWLITKRTTMVNAIRRYGNDLREAYYEAKYAALYRQQDDI